MSEDNSSYQEKIALIMEIMTRFETTKEVMDELEIHFGKPSSVEEVNLAGVNNLLISYNTDGVVLDITLPVDNEPLNSYTKVKETPDLSQTIKHLDESVLNAMLEKFVNDDNFEKAIIVRDEIKNRKKLG